MHRFRWALGFIVAVMVFGAAGVSGAAEVMVELNTIAFLGAPGDNPPPAVLTAITVLQEEMEKRMGAPLKPMQLGVRLVAIHYQAGAFPAEGFRVSSKENGVLLEAGDGRGMIYAVGWLLRHITYKASLALVPDDLAMESAPDYAIRGHQLGYRHRANSWDAWDVAQFDQHIRELALFGANCIENIPFEDNREIPHMKLSREEMNLRLSEICDKYDLDYWVWAPAEFDLSDGALRAADVARHAAFYASCKRLDAVFFPGGDPGGNHPKDVLPFLGELAPRLQEHHPKAKLWLSMQGWEEDKVDYFFEFIQREQPDWFGGVVHGPSSPDIKMERARLPKKYLLRRYPDLTHTVRCQYPVQWWDPAFAKTLGRECINPQPQYYSLIHDAYAPYSDGFLAYSDGVHDDVNKAMWSLKAWDSDYDAREAMVEYARFFFNSDVAEDAADGILALEKNWEGALANNGGVTATLRLWQDLEKRAPELEDNWRWQMCLVRAYYDAYTRERLRYERGLEAQANALLAQTGEDLSAEAAMNQALSLVRQADTNYAKPEWRERVIGLYEALFQSIQLQSSVPKYQGSGYERGCSLDFLDYPLNNRWWLEDEFKKISALNDEAEKAARLHALAAWENPGSGSYYDNIGHPGQSPHVLRGERLNTDPSMRRDPNTGDWWWDDGFSRQRLSFQTTMDWPLALRYEALDPEANYVLRLTGCGKAMIKADGSFITTSLEPVEVGEFMEFTIPHAATKDGALSITFDRPQDEAHLNWRQQSRVSEAWLLKR
jgi:hypothetical protein